jgi:ubiquinone/menaquinone biosynthesis C-methylase UbiE
MSSRQRLFRMLYRLGFTPWDGHPLSQRLRDLVEGSGQTPALNPGLALDIGCGTGDSSIYLAQHGWRVIGVDYVSRPLAKARAKAEANRVSVEFVEADVTRLSATGIGAGFDLVVDNGCLHGMSGEDRDAYVREVTAVAAPEARLVIVAFVPGSSFGVPGIEPAEVERRFSASWQLLASGDETTQDHNRRNAARNYLFERGAR